MTTAPAQASPEIDAVITWVDGADPAHRDKLRAYLRSANLPATGAADPTRFGDCGEIEFCVSSLFRFAPWLRTIHIVTDCQTPALAGRLRDSPFGERLRIVDHREIFAGLERHLPTFNSLSIESVLWRIPGLAERFIYFNDDVFLIRPVRPEDFFRGESAVLRGTWRSVARRASRQRQPGEASNPDAQQRAADMVGFDEAFFQAPHCPHPMFRSQLAWYFDNLPFALEENVRWRLRDATQFLPVALANHLQFSRGTAIVDNRLRTLRMKPSERGFLHVLAQALLANLRPRIAFACVQSLDAANSRSRNMLRHWLERRIGRRLQPE